MEAHRAGVAQSAERNFPKVEVAGSSPVPRSTISNGERPVQTLSDGAGLGDGVYASYLGYDTSGQVVALVTDFGVLDRASLATTGEQTAISTRI